MTGYREILAVPGMAALLGVSFLARTAITSVVMALTMHVVLDLDLNYAAAGGVAAALTAGLALGGPLLGRMLDGRGLRTVLTATVAAQAVFWPSATVLPYEILLGAAFAAGLLMVPVQPVTRQAIAAMMTVAQRRAAFALESVQGELSYMVGPAAVIACAAVMSPAIVVWAVGAAIVIGGTVLAVLDPPLRSAEDAHGGPAGRPPRRREWLNGGMIAVLLMAFGTTTLLSGVDLAVVATLEEAGQVSWAAVVVAVLGVTSVVGGLIYGTLSRSLPAWLLLGSLGLVTVPAGLAHGWPWLCVSVVGVGFLAAPSLSAVTEAVSRLAPAAARGEATGLQSSAQNAGFALGSPIIGAAIDVWAPAAGFAVAGLAGCAAALTGWLLSRRGASPAGRPVAASGTSKPKEGAGGSREGVGRANGPQAP
ncbi:MFS transporter [Streptomyces venezuelae]|uniref:MFS transporter n=1 Tax=Streptomyces venezuelae TaxID=54571 RepID=UPI00378C2D29